MCPQRLRHGRRVVAAGCLAVVRAEAHEDERGQHGDRQLLRIKLWVNDVMKQNGNSKQMVYSIAEQIAYLSRHLALRPGDVIATGCPAGVGLPNGDFLKVGDEIRIEIDGIGTMINSVVAR